MMKSYSLIAVGLIGGVVVAFLLWQKPDPAQELVTYTDTEAVDIGDTAEPKETSFSDFGTLASITGVGQSGYCTFTSTENDTVTDGEFWFDGDHFAMTATSRVSAELYTSNVINDGSQTFFWGGTAAGSMALVIPNNLAVNSSDELMLPSNRFDVSTSVAYTCTEEVVGAQTFVPPSTITFTDAGALMDGMFEGELRGIPEGMDMGSLEEMIIQE